MPKDWSKVLEDEDEEAVFARIQEESLRHYSEVELRKRNLSRGDGPHINGDDGGSESDKAQLSGNGVFYRGSEPGSEGFHLAAGQTYIYPTNYPLREYQVNIVRSALFHNTLVCLPTGLGKTFIAAVVIYNYYRWFPRGKIVFMAPTRPLVSQQMRACHDVMAIPLHDTVEMTGTLNPIERAAYWKTKRVFFLTPQILTNDLRNKACPAISIKCVVVDEAHRATKEYAYCQVVRGLEDAGATFRMLALSATPGNNVKSVVEVVQNLRISKLELRGEESLDVAKYTHAKDIRTVVVQPSPEILDVREQFLNIFDKYSRSLREARLITTHVNNMTKFQLLKSMERVKSHVPTGMSKTSVGYLISDMTVCMSLAHALELLQVYGLRAFQHYLTAGIEESDKSGPVFTRLKKDGDLYELLDKLQKMLTNTEIKVWSHPKLERMVDVIKEHFCAPEQNKNSKAIIFCQYRVVVSEVFDILNKLDHSIKPIMFVGQSSSRQKSGLPQKKQLEVMKSFRNGDFNILIATCVAEEGLDIGAVDLIILMEAHRSPVRLVQRLGRTGRHRQGQCVVLLTQGKEVQRFKEAMATRKSYLTTVMNSPLISANMYDKEPPMLPPGVHPEQLLLHIHVARNPTPVKSKKQTDIRSAFSAVQPPESPFLSPDQIVQVMEELKTRNINFNRFSYLSNRCYLWNRIEDKPMKSEELFNTSFSHLSEWNDWNRNLQPTFEVGHSSDTDIFCHLLQKVDLLESNEHSNLGLNSQLCVNELLKRNCIPNKKKKKEDKLNCRNLDSNTNICSNPKMDIRNCLALAGERTKLTQQKLLDEFNMLSQKQKLSKMTAEEPEDCNVISPVPNHVPCEKECELSDSKCIFSSNSFEFLATILSPKPVVNPISSNDNVKKVFTLDEIKLNVTLKAIQEFNIAETFNKNKTFKYESGFIDQKLKAEALIGISNCKQNEIRKHETSKSSNCGLIDENNKIFKSQPLQINLSENIIPQSKMYCNIEAETKEREKFTPIYNCENKSLEQHLVNSPRNCQKPEVLPYKDDVISSGIEDYNTHSLTNINTKNKNITQKSLSEKSSVFDIVDIDELFTEEMKHEMENSLFESTPESSKQALNNKQNSLNMKYKVNGKHNSLSDLNRIKDCSAYKNGDLKQRKSDADKIRFSQSFLESDYVDIDDLFDDDINWSSIKNTSAIKDSQTNCAQKSRNTSHIQNFILQKNTLTSPQTSKSSKKDKIIFDFKISDEKINSSLMKISSHNVSNDSTNLELSPIISGRPCQLINTTNKDKLESSLNVSDGDDTDIENSAIISGKAPKFNQTIGNNILERSCNFSDLRLSPILSGIPSSQLTNTIKNDKLKSRQDISDSDDTDVERSPLISGKQSNFIKTIGNNKLESSHNVSDGNDLQLSPILSGIPSSQLAKTIKNNNLKNHHGINDSDDDTDKESSPTILRKPSNCINAIGYNELKSSHNGSDFELSPILSGMPSSHLAKTIKNNNLKNYHDMNDSDDDTDIERSPVISEKPSNLINTKENKKLENSHNGSDLELSPILSGISSSQLAEKIKNNKLKSCHNISNSDDTDIECSPVLRKSLNLNNSVSNSKLVSSCNISYKNDGTDLELSPITSGKPSKLNNPIANGNLENDSDNWSISQLFEDSNCSEKSNYNTHTIGLLENTSKFSESNNKMCQKSFVNIDSGNDKKVVSNSFTFNMIDDDIMENEKNQQPFNNNKLKSDEKEFNSMLDVGDDDFFLNVNEDSGKYEKNKCSLFVNSCTSKETNNSKNIPNLLQTLMTSKCTSQISSVVQKSVQKLNLNSESAILKNSTGKNLVNVNQTKVSERIKPTSSNAVSTSDDKLLSLGWMRNRTVSVSLKNNTKNSKLQWFDCSDSDTDNDVFENTVIEQKKPSKIENRKKLKKKQFDEKKGNDFVIEEADVSGIQMSSDEENTSGLDEFDHSFIDDLTHHQNTSNDHTTVDIQSLYLQATKSPLKRPGCFKIPDMPQTEVFPKCVTEEPDSYINDSFCVDETEIIDYDPSILEIAEQILESKQNKKRKINGKRKYSSSDSSCIEESFKEDQSVNESLPRRRRRRRKVCKLVSDGDTSDTSGE